jgi:hypothetical protein
MKVSSGAGHGAGADPRFAHEEERRGHHGLSPQIVLALMAVHPASAMGAARQIIRPAIIRIRASSFR